MMQSQDITKMASHGGEVPGLEGYSLQPQFFSFALLVVWLCQFSVSCNSLGSSF